VSSYCRRLFYSLAGFTLITLVVLSGLTRSLDEYAYAHFRAYNNLVDLITETASIVFLGVAWLILVAVSFFRLRRLGKLTFRLGLLLVVSAVLDAALKLVFRIPRPGGGAMPEGLLQALEFFSYPSGHSTRAVAISLLLGGEYGYPWNILLYTWATAVCLTRVLLGVHWLSDVVGGIAAGFIVYYATEILDIPVRRLLKLIHLDFILGSM